MLLEDSTVLKMLSESNVTPQFSFISIMVSKAVIIGDEERNEEQMIQFTAR